MNKQEIIQTASEYVRTAGANRVQKEYAIAEDLIGTPMYAEPLFAFGSADDPLFEELKSPKAIGPFHLSPTEWLPGARTVISFFLPASDEVRQSNRTDPKLPSSLWLHTRIEGQKFLCDYSLYIKDLLERSGSQAVVPGVDKRVWAKAGPDNDLDDISFTSNWSERHVGYVCGLGTFGLSRGLITKKGVAGRIGSVVTDAYFEPDSRAYTDLYEYCNKCGACIRRCPAQAISLEKGKEHKPCSNYLDKMMELYRPRYACGKCQAGVPCESGIPKRK